MPLASTTDTAIAPCRKTLGESIFDAVGCDVNARLFVSPSVNEKTLGHPPAAERFSLLRLQLNRSLARLSPLVCSGCKSPAPFGANHWTESSRPVNESTGRHQVQEEARKRRLDSNSISAKLNAVKFVAGAAPTGIVTVTVSLAVFAGVAPAPACSRPSRNPAG
jgi:hypothetical protein